MDKQVCYNVLKKDQDHLTRTEGWVLITHSSGANELISILEKANILNAVNSNGDTFLHISVLSDHDKFVNVTRQLIIQSKCQINAQNIQGKTPLMVAIENRCINSSKLLLDANADIFITDNEGKSALHYFAAAQWFHHYQLVWIILKKVESHCLFHSQAIAIILFNAGWSLRGVTIERIEVAKWMLSLGCQVDEREINNNRTLLHEAVLADDVEGVKFLLDHNANPNALDKFKRSPLHYVYEDKYPSINMHEHTAARLKIVKMFIDRGAAMFLPTRTGNVGLNQIIGLLHYGNSEVIRILLKANLNLNKPDSNGNTPLHSLAVNRNPDVFEVLDDQIFKVDIFNSDLDTPLSIAASCGNAHAVEFLLKKNAYTNYKNINNRSPLSRCIREFSLESKARYKKCVQLLLEYGAEIQLEFLCYLSKLIQGNQSTVFGFVQEEEMSCIIKVLIEHAILRDVKGMSLGYFPYCQNRWHQDFKTHYDFCNKQLTIELHKSATLLKLLSESDHKFERYVRDQQFSFVVKNFNKDWKTKLYYFNAILQKRYAKAVYTLKLREDAGILMGKIMKTDYFRYPSIIDEIVSYLDEFNLQNFLKIDL